MNIENIKVGMYIIIADCIDITEARHTICSQMSDMRNKRFRIESINMELNRVEVNGWSWAPEDIRSVSNEPFNIGQTVFHFDTKALT